MKKIALILVLSICSFSCAYPVVMVGNSMLPTIKDGDRMMLNTNFGELKRGDIVSHLYPKDQTKTYMKRIVGLPNETIEIRNGVVFIDGKEIAEPYLEQIYNQAGISKAAMKIESDSYFVMGDNRDNSADSRTWGTVKKDLIQGTMWFTYAEGNKK